MWVRDTTAGSGLCAWRSVGVLQAMNGLDGMAKKVVRQDGGHQQFKRFVSFLTNSVGNLGICFTSLVGHYWDINPFIPSFGRLFPPFFSDNWSYVGILVPSWLQLSRRQL